MSPDAAPLWLRPVHRWFFWWEDVVPSVYRVVAVAVAAMVTAALLVAVGVHPLVAAPSALLGWIGLAVAQEYDERVTVPVDAEFHRLLRDVVDPVVAPHGFVFTNAFGPTRARRDRTDVFLYERPHPSEGCIDLWIRRDLTVGSMEVAIGGRELAPRLSAVGEERLAARIQRARQADADVDTLREALLLMPPELWT